VSPATHPFEAEAKLLEKRDEITEGHVLHLPAADAPQQLPVPHGVVLLERGKTEFAVRISRLGAGIRGDKHLERF